MKPPTYVHLRRRHHPIRFLLFCLGSGLLAASAPGQSTLGSIRGTVHDPSGAVVANATVTLHRIESNTDRTLRTTLTGEYAALNLDPGHYDLHITAPGFSPEDDAGLELTARQQLTYDIALSISRGTETVTVNASDAGAINNTDASISASLSPEAVLDLPANYRGAGSTSPLNVIQTLPGVQPDSGSYPPTPSASPNPGIKFSIQGGLPSQSETTVDGISAQNQTANNIQADAFPSAESIAEIRVDGVGNNAEFGQPGEITTVTKSGTDDLHGSAFWYFQNSAFDAIPFGFTQATKPKKVANDFGGSAGGPVVIPHLYNGHDKSFFFATYEGLRFPQAVGRHLLVPTLLMKGGNFSQETSTLTDPATGLPFANATLPAISPSAAAFLSIYPDPNVAGFPTVKSALAGNNGYNYVDTRRNDITSNQYDLRFDQNLGHRLSVFARYTNKTIDQSQPADLLLPNGTGFSRYHIFATAANLTLTPRLVNEFRFGFTLEQDGAQNPFNGNALTSSAGFVGTNPAFFNGFTHVAFNQLTSSGERLNYTQQSRIFQYVDNLTWQRGDHTIRFGADFRHLGAYTEHVVYPSDNLGNLYFDGIFTGQEFADYLIGAPDTTAVDNITSDNIGSANSYAFYAQDSWKATPRLTLNLGLRYEFHPAFTTTSQTIGNFDPSVAGSGRVIYNDGHAAGLDPQELASFNACQTAGVTNPYANNLPQNGAPCTPVLSNSQAGLPSGLRTSPKLRFEPRFGFAFRPFGNDRTAIRGGVGYYNITTTGAIFYALTSTVNTNLRVYNNVVAPTDANPTTHPLFTFPNIVPASAAIAAPDFGNPGTVFYSAVDTKWHDPYSLQTSLSIDRDLGHNFGLRLSYVGLKTWHLVWQPELDMLHYSTTTLALAQPRSAFPFPNFLSIPDRSTSAQADYNSGQAELSRRFSHGLSFDSAYTYAKNLSDNQGTYGAYQTASNFVDEQGGYSASYTYDRHIDYGNVTGTRRHRFLSSSVFELPVGRGQRFGGGMNRLADAAIGGWQVSGIFLLQTGPFLTPIIPWGANIDPSGTGSSSIYQGAQRPDRTANGNASGSTRNRNNWFNKAAFTCPGGHDVDGNTGISSLQSGGCIVGGTGTDPATVSATNAGRSVSVLPIGRFGTSTVGDVNGPGTVSLSTGASKQFPITERVHLRAEGTFTNVLNHTNLADPVLDTTNPAFGTIGQSRGSDFGGNRTGQVSVKLEF